MQALLARLEKILGEIAALSKRVARLERREISQARCRVYNSGAFSHNSSGNYLAITFDSERYDTGGMHEGVTNPSRITFARAGTYRVFGHIAFAPNATNNRRLAIRLNATTYIAIQLGYNSGGTIDIALSTEYEFAAGDYVELMAWQDSGGSLNINATGNYTPEFGASRIL